MGQEIISRKTKEKCFGVVIQDNSSSEKHTNKIFGNTHPMIRSIVQLFTTWTKI